ncbi:MAG: glycosyltransferase family 2 protein [Chloroflexia bacterium]|nr:glycosyltransferase family 2 protein [Chloroflexia bacterium]
MDLDLSIVMPAHNEAGRVGGVVAEARRRFPQAEILVVDDASSDETAQEAEQAGARVVRHPYNKGNGAAVKTGIRNARGEVVVLMDADGQHKPEDIPRLLQRMGDYDLVVGARDPSTQASWLRRMGNAVFNSLATYLTGRPIPDLTSGFRAARREPLREFLSLLPNGYSYPTTITLAFLKAGYSVDFVPIQSGQRQGGKSGMRLLRDGVKFIMIILRIITLFTPLKVFFPLSVLCFVLSALSAGYTVFIEQRLHIPNSAVLLLMMSIFVFLIGLVSEQIAMLRFEGKDH